MAISSQIYYKSLQVCKFLNPSIKIYEIYQAYVW